MFRGTGVWRQLNTGFIDEHVRVVREYIVNIYFYTKNGKTIMIDAAVSWIACLLCILLTVKCSRWFLILAVFIGIYGFVCTRCALSYGKLLKGWEIKE